MERINLLDMDLPIKRKMAAIINAVNKTLENVPLQARNKYSCLRKILNKLILWSLLKSKINIKTVIYRIIFMVNVTSS